tara:strand:+ start:427 stop:1440 length:1014 start_codon:yes stop_codon:yes gene_type:complete
LARNPTDRPEWFAQVQEDVIEPEMPILDPHFHFFTGRGHEFLAQNFLDYVDQGHKIVGAIHVEANADFFAGGGACGEMRFAINQGAIMRKLQQGRETICDPTAGVVGYTDLRGGEVEAELEVLQEAAENRLCAIRNSAAWDEDEKVPNGHTKPPQGLLIDPDFQKGIRQLAQKNLCFDSFCYFTQIPELIALAQAVPEAKIVCEHLGGIVGVGRYKDQQKAYFDQWRANISELATCENVVIKLGAVAMSLSGFGWHKRGKPLGSNEYADFYSPWFLHAIEAFGPERCMFESNFPVDGVSISYGVLWNAFKRIAGSFSVDEKAFLFHKTAATTYRLDI